MLAYETSGATLRRRTMIKGAAALAAAFGAVTPGRAQAAGQEIEINGLRLYYEDHGPDDGSPPIVLLHGALMAVETAFADLLPYLARDRRVIAIEAQGHGHTADRPGLLSEDQLVADTAGLLDALGIESADFIGHSLGAMIAGGTAIRRPDLVRTVTLIGRHASTDGMLPELVAMQANPQEMPSPALAAILPSQEDFMAWAAHYARTAPDPSGFQQLAMKVQQLTASWPGWSTEQLRSIAAPTLIVIGDRDFVRPDHAAEMAATIPDAQLAILPGTTHMSMLRRGAWLDPMFRARWDSVRS